MDQEQQASRGLEPDYLHFETDLSDPATVACYDELPLWSAQFGSLLLKHLPLRPHIRVLDVGCGTGFPTLELAQRLGLTCTVYGIDPWQAALQRAELKARQWNVRNVEFRPECGEAMSFPDGHFDLIVSNLGINNFADPQAALAECWRVARPSAKLALTTNLKGHMAEFYEVFESTLWELGNRQAVEALHFHIAHRSTVAGVTALLAQVGFRVSKVYEEPAVMRFVGGSSLLRHYFIKLAFLDAWKNIIDSNEQEAVLLRLESNLNHLAQKQGELTLTVPMAYIEAEKSG